MPSETPVNVKKLGHIVFTVSDIERTTRFWTEIMGFQVSDRNERGFVFRPRAAGEPAPPLVARRPAPIRDQCASGSGRSWKWTAMGFLPLPPSISHGARSPLVVQSPRPFQPAAGSSMRPSKPLA